MYIFRFLFLIVIITVCWILYFTTENKKIYTPSIGMSYIAKKDTFFYLNDNCLNKEKNIAIITTLTNYRSNVIYGFVNSLDNVNFKGHIILFVSEVLKFNFSNPIIHQILVNVNHPYYSSNNTEYPIPKEKLEEYIPNNLVKILSF